MLQRQSIPPIHDVDIRLLRAFKSVVDCGGVSAAEEVLGLGRSAISKHLSDLESRLSIRLCERGRSGFAMTPHGETVYQATIELMDALDRFRAEISLAKGMLSGSVSLWLLDNLHLEPGNPISAALQGFSRRSKDLTLSLTTAGPEEAEEAVSTGLAHMAVTTSNSALPELTYLELAVHRSALYVASDIVKTGTAVPLDMTNINLVTPAYYRGHQLAFGDKWRSTAIANDVDAAVQLILTGEYAGLLPDHIARPWIKAGRMAPLAHEEASFETPTFLVFRSKSKATPMVRILTEDIVGAYNRKIAPKVAA